MTVSLTVRALDGARHLRALAVLTVLGVIAASLLPATLRAQGAKSKHVLLLYSHEQAMYGQFDAPLRSALTTELAHPVDFYTEYLDLIRFPRESYEQQLVDSLRAKYAERGIDLIVVVSALAFDFVRERGSELFPGTPVVFASVNAASIDRKSLPSHITGVA